MEDETKKIDEKKVKIKKWDHLAVRPDVFDEFNSLKLQAGCRSANSFIVELLRIYGKRLLGAEYKPITEKEGEERNE